MGRGFYRCASLLRMLFKNFLTERWLFRAQVDRTNRYKPSADLQAEHQACVQGSLTKHVASTLYIRPTGTTTVLSWERSLALPLESFVVYRGTTARWEDAGPIQQPIFCSANPQHVTIEYHCMDHVPHEAQETYYWLATQTQGKVAYQGPFLLQTYSIEAFAPMADQAATVLKR